VVEAVNRAMNAARRLGVQQLYVFNQSFDLRCARSTASAYGQGVTDARHVTLVTTSSGQA
jgi:hypothetical protein